MKYQRDKFWIWHVIVRKGEAVIRYFKPIDHPDNQTDSVELDILQEDDCTECAENLRSSCPGE